VTVPQARSYGGTDTAHWVKHGLIGGIIGGIVFALFEMISAALLNGAAAFFMPLRSIGGIVLGMQALDPSFPLATAASVGMATHMVLSMIYGVVFAVAVGYLPALRSSSGVLIGAATLWGLLLWLVNFYVIAPIAGWDWFAMANPVVQFLAHAFFYGSVLGLYLDRAAVSPQPHDG
jgi:cellulose synthase/poly-beta-1,6-N-acetylglucosamine synthase-like glycosyltransferase